MNHPDEPHDRPGPDRPRITGPGPHDDALLWVSKELDGEITERERVLLGDHLEACLACSTVRRELRGIRSAARTHDAAQLPVGLVDRVATHVLAPEPAAAVASPRSPLLQLLRRSAAAAAAVLLLLGGIYVDGCRAPRAPRNTRRTPERTIHAERAPRWATTPGEPAYFSLPPASASK
jgi:hypothetical protein